MRNVCLVGWSVGKEEVEIYICEEWFSFFLCIFIYIASADLCGVGLEWDYNIMSSVSPPVKARSFVRRARSFYVSPIIMAGKHYSIAQ